MLTEGTMTAVGKMGDEEFHLLCADCDEGYNNTSCMNSKGYSDRKMCDKETKRCKCGPGFIGPSCHICPVEGTVSLHLDDGSVVCSVCGEGNSMAVWDFDGTNTMCLPFPEKPLVFEDADGTPVLLQLASI